MQTVLPYTYAYVMAGPIGLYANPADPENGIPPKRVLEAGYVWVRLVGQVVHNNQVWYLTEGGGYLSALQAAIYKPSAFQGVVPSGNPAVPFAWVLHAVKTFHFDLKDAGGLMFWFSVVAMACKLTSGAVADVIDRHKVFTACFVIMFLGVLGLASMRQDLLFPAAVTIAIGWGGLFTLYNMLAVSNFGLREIGRINGAISFLEAIGAGLGSWITGKLFDQTGSYQVPFMALAVMVFVAVIMSRFVRSEVDDRILAAR